MTPPELLPFAHHLQRTRWFGGKGRPFRVPEVRRLAELPRPAGTDPDGPRVLVHLVEVAYDDGAAGGAADGGTERYQVPLACYAAPQDHLEHALVGSWDEPGLGAVHCYDAVHDRRATDLWLRAFDEAGRSGGSLAVDGLVFRRLPGHDLDLEAHSTVFSGEQSNSSMAFGDDALMKVFRKLTPGTNPDIEVHEELTAAGSDHVAALFGWLEATDPGTGEVLHLAMLQQFLRTGSDGWELALASVRNLFAEEELHAREVGGDFSAEASRLGTSLAEVHAVMAERFPTAERRGDDVAALVRGLEHRLATALGAVPALEPYAERLRALYARVGELDAVPVQRVHGDLHLGQTLRTSRGWKLVDFEGEPARPLPERRLPDSPWRDVAGMLRSFDYAPHVVARTIAEDDASATVQLAAQADEWAHRNRNHFLTAYAGRGLTDEEHVLLDAYEADKAVYETLYETRNRPGWVDVPLAAVARIGA